MGMVFLGSAMRGEQKLHAKFTACRSKDLDGTGEKPAAGLTMLPPSLHGPLGYLWVQGTLQPSPTPSLPQGMSTNCSSYPASHQEGDNSLPLMAFTGSLAFLRRTAPACGARSRAGERSTMAEGDVEGRT